MKGANRKMKEQELKRCPFCGGLPEVGMGTDGARIRCSVCGVSTEYFRDTAPVITKMENSRYFEKTKEGTYGINEAFEFWNRRLED